MIGKTLSSLLKLPIWVYRWFVSPILPMSCRFEPTCSTYAIEALDRHGPVFGLWLAVRRVVRCQPWGGAGYDPVPERPAGASERTISASGR